MRKEEKTVDRLKFHWATPSRWKDLEKLFGERGACGGCWCMVWRLSSKDWQAGKGAANKRALQRLVSKGERPGVLAYLGKEAIAWCAIAPRSEYSYLARSRVLRAIDDEPVWSISCLFVLKPYRRQGVSVALLQAAVELAKKRGAKIVEAYPSLPKMEKIPDTFVWTGVPSAFKKAGFSEAARHSPTRPIMRRRSD
ncbi:MAG TPA: GNAT family N-acetyltransferase [Candidatus Krumholzibacteria bacterium]|nr:GNAT family N-acetyltransferase [Candidatus Krumholzibacteria bacterium]